MKKQLILLCVVAMGFAYSQIGKVGVNNPIPKATLDINASDANAQNNSTTNEGLLIPRLSKERLKSIATDNLTESTLVYVNDATYDPNPVTIDVTSDPTIDVTSKGFYYYSSAEKKWINIQDLRMIGSNNHITQDAGIEGKGTKIGGEYNIAMGSGSLYSNTKGTSNIGIGLKALKSNTVGEYNTAIGRGSLYSNTRGRSNIGIGLNALNDNTVGEYNVSLGEQSMYCNFSGQHNVAIGYKALYSNKTSYGSIAIGPYALNHSSAIGNIGMGHKALYENRGGLYNIALGTESLSANIEGNYNIAIGYKTLLKNTEGENNITIGERALEENVYGSDNIALGNTSGDWIKGNNNIHIGIGNLRFFKENTDELDNVIVIGNVIKDLNTSTSNDNVIILGNEQNSRFSQDVGIGIFKPQEKLHVAGNIAVGGTVQKNDFPTVGNYISFEGTSTVADRNFPNTDVLAFYRYDESLNKSQLRLLIGDGDGDNGSQDSFSIGVRANSSIKINPSRDENIANAYTEKFRFSADGNAYKYGSSEWSVLSDARIKENVKPYTKGLKELLQIRPVNFNYKKEINKGNKEYVGVIAQELEKVVPSMVNTSKEKVGNIDHLKTVDGNEYTFMLINAVKELSKKVEQLEAEIKTLKK